MALGDMVFNSDGKSVHVNLTAGVEKNKLVVVDGWVGIAASNGDSGDTIALTSDGREYQLEVPPSLGAVRGDVIYIELADVTGHYPDSTAYSLNSAGAGLVAFMKVTQDQDTNNVVVGRLMWDQEEVE